MLYYERNQKGKEGGGRNRSSTEQDLLQEMTVINFLARDSNTYNSQYKKYKKEELDLSATTDVLSVDLRHLGQFRTIFP